MAAACPNLTSPLGLPSQSNQLFPLPRGTSLPPFHHVVKLLPCLFIHRQTLGKDGQPQLPTHPGQLVTSAPILPGLSQELDPLDSFSTCSSPLESVTDTSISSSALFLSPFDFQTASNTAGAEPWTSPALGVIKLRALTWGIESSES